MRNILSKIVDREGYLIMDGGMGSGVFRRYNCNYKSFGYRCVDYLNCYDSNTIEEIHTSFLRSGSRLIKSNTFNCAQLFFEQLKDETINEHNKQSGSLSASDITLRGVKIAKDAIRKFCSLNALQEEDFCVAGVIALPYIKYCESDNNIWIDCFRKQIESLLLGGVDIIFLESLYDLKKTELALQAIQECKAARGLDSINLMLSFSPTENFTLLSGENVFDAIESILKSYPNLDYLSFGLNCANGSKQLSENIVKLEKFFYEHSEFHGDIYLSLHPSLGIPKFAKDEEMGVALYPDTTEDFVSNLLKATKSCNSLKIIGGCCGVSPNEIRELSSKLKNN